MSADFEVKNKTFLFIILFYITLTLIALSGVIHTIPNWLFAILSIPCGLIGLIFPIKIYLYLRERLHHFGMSQSRADNFSIWIVLVSFSVWGVFLEQFI